MRQPAGLAITTDMPTFALDSGQVTSDTPTLKSIDYRGIT
jgi:hypothetical protein